MNAHPALLATLAALMLFVCPVRTATAQTAAEVKAVDAMIAAGEPGAINFISICHGGTATDEIRECGLVRPADVDVTDAGASRLFFNYMPATVSSTCSRWLPSSHERHGMQTLRIE